MTPLHYDTAGYRETSTATEYRRPDGSTVQMSGHGAEVRAVLCLSDEGSSVLAMNAVTMASAHMEES